MPTVYRAGSAFAGNKVVAVFGLRTPLYEITSTGGIEQRFR